MPSPLDLKNPASFRSRKPSRRKMLSFAALLLLALGVAGYFYWKSRTLEGMKNVVPEAANETLRAVGEHIMLPDGVTPRIGRVANTEDFKNDPFLRQAEVGDVVLFYPHEGRTVKAILWRPSAGKIVDVSLVELPEPGGK